MKSQNVDSYIIAWRGMRRTEIPLPHVVISRYSDHAYSRIIIKLHFSVLFVWVDLGFCSTPPFLSLLCSNRIKRLTPLLRWLSLVILIYNTRHRAGDKGASQKLIKKDYLPGLVVLSWKKIAEKEFNIISFYSSIHLPPNFRTVFFSKMSSE